ncbi:MAG: TolC family protein [Bacteroidales bacterium]
MQGQINTHSRHRFSFIIILIIVLLFILPSGRGLYAQDNGSEYTLTQLLDSALQNNRLLMANKKNTVIKQAEIDILRKNYQPTISTSASISTWKFLLPNKQRLLGDALTDVYTDISIRQTIYDGGENKAKRALVEEEILLNDEIHRQIQNTIIIGVSDTYFEILKAKWEVEAYRNSLGQLNSQLEYSENLYKRGKVSKVDILKVTVQISVAEKNLNRALNAEEVFKTRLGRQCYLKNNEPLKVTKLSDNLYHRLQNHFFSADSLYAEVLQNHPSLLASSYRLEIEAKQKEIYQLQSLPDIFTYGTGSWEHGYIPFGDNFNYNIGVGVSYTIPLWGGSAHKTKMKQSKLLTEQIEYEKEQDFQNIKEEIDIALNEIRTIKDDIYDNKKIIDLANETLDNAMVKYRGGQGTIIDVLDAQTILTKAAIDFRKSTVAYLQTIAKLHYLTGNNNYPF